MLIIQNRIEIDIDSPDGNQIFDFGQYNSRKNKGIFLTEKYFLVLLSQSPIIIQQPDEDMGINHKIIDSL